MFEDIGKEAAGKAAAKTYADWCFERRAQLPAEWTAVDTSATEAKARDFLRSRFEACFPFHPATLSVFQRKWQSLSQFQQTRGTLAMLAQWISWAYRDGYQRARREPLITLGSAPLVVLADRSAADGIKEIDLGAGHASASDTLGGRVLAALRAGSLLNESPGAGYIERRWPEPFKETGAWPLSSLRQAFLTGAMERLVDVDMYLKAKVPEFVSRGDYGLASGQQPDGTYARVWFNEPLLADEVVFEAGVYLLTKQRAKALKAAPAAAPGAPAADTVTPEPIPGASPLPGLTEPGESSRRRIRVTGTIPPELWNRLGTKLIPKVRAGEELHVGIDITVEVDGTSNLESELRLILKDLDLADRVRVESS